MEDKIKNMRWTIWILAVMFYLYEYILRVFPSVIVPELMGTFHVNASVLGLISAFYLFAYAPMQLPVGFLMDRFSARKLITFASLICGIGAIGFGLAQSIWILYLSRFIMGFGSSFAFLGAMYVSTHWFAEKKAALLIPLVNSLGMLGPFLGQGPFGLLAKHFGYEIPLVLLGVFGVILSVIFFYILRSEPKKMQKLEHKRPKFTTILKNSKEVFTHAQTWLNAIIALLTYLTTVAFAGFWGVPFLQRAHAFDKELAGFAISMIFIGWIVGGPLMGYFVSKKIFKKKTLIIIGSLLACLCLIPVLYIPHLNPWFTFSSLFLVGFFTSSQIFTYSLAVAHNQPETKGTTVAFINFATFVGGCIMQPLIGLILVYLWDGQTTQGVPVYSLSMYHKALIGLPLSYLASFVLAFFLTEKRIHRKLPHQE
ncbi:MAG: putative sulfoacetate transporter SauU [Chlamydiae bacterium]|nr:putative sulfoacetate transporter SauU [Chlamydiota bacterium]